MRRRRAIRQTHAVLDVFIEAGLVGKVYAKDLMRDCRLTSAALYPILDNLEVSGWISGFWDDQTAPGRPRRRYYRMTSKGIVEAQRGHWAVL